MMSDKLPTPVELFGIECRSGWKDIYTPVIEAIQKYNEEHSDEDPVEILQIKEKYGRLCIYVSRQPATIREMIRQAEKESWETCEICGSKKQITHTQGWIQTLCEECYRNKIGR